MDLGLSTDPVESFKLFQGIIKKEYDRMAEPEGFVVMDATKSIEEQQEQMRQIVEKALANYHSPISRQADHGTIISRRRRYMTDNLYYGIGLPYLKFDRKTLQGKLIVIEGADCSGRSTQVAMLKEWLESNGHAVLDTGLRRSGLVGEAIEEAKKGHTLGKKTMSLLYATDFADQLENKIIPGMKAGYIVLADRYFFTLMVRDMIRGADKEWLKELFGFALVPDHIFYMSVDPDILLHRALHQVRPARLLGVRHGRVPVERHVRQLQEVPERAEGHVRRAGHGLWLR